MVKKFLLCALIVSGWIAGESHAGVVYDETYTGADLAALVGTADIDMAATRTRAWTPIPQGGGVCYHGYFVPPETDSIFFTQSNTVCGGAPSTPCLLQPPVVGGDNCEKSEKLLELPLVPAGDISTGETVTVTLSASLSWVGGPGGGSDWSDPALMLSDGVHLTGIGINDEGYDKRIQPWGGTELMYCTASGDMCLDVGYPDPVNPADYLLGVPPMIETGGTYLQTYDVTVVWILKNGSTKVEAALLGKQGAETIPIEGIVIEALDLNGPLSFVFLSDNQNHEVYQINSLSLRVEVGELTCNCSTPGLFDPPMDVAVSVKKPNRVLPLKTTLCDASGNPLTDMDISAPMADVDYDGPAVGIAFNADDYLSAGHGDDTNLFAYAGSHWQLNLQTKMFAAKGVYTITVVSTDPRYYFSPSCSVDFIIE